MIIASFSVLILFEYNNLTERLFVQNDCVEFNEFHRIQSVQ